MSEESSSLVSQCLAFCQMLATTNQAFNFTLTLGSSFNFCLDTRVKYLAPVSKKRSSPSTQRRNARRRQEYLDIKNSVGRAENEKQTGSKSAEIKTFSQSCEICDFSANSSIALNIHMKKQHENLAQLDGNMSLTSVIIEDIEPAKRIKPPR